MFSVEPSAQCENVIKTRPAVNIRICERDFHCDQANTIIMIIMTRLIIKKTNSTTGREDDGGNSDDDEFVTNNDSQSG